ncbi:MAG: hypothetical protein EA417_00120 [Gammaproteobacteria bacterium]|nr:MAG: hypothetical protein EA417_00120 [Gammaproteobacteria bacterium]
MSLSPANTAIAGLQILNSADARAVLDQMVAAVQQWQHTVETEHTKRTAITAHEQKWLAAIETDRQVLLTYLDRSFDERADNFCRLFDSLDQAMTTETTQVGDILSAITTLAMTNPFSELRDVATVTANLHDKDHEW